MSHPTSTASDWHAIVIGSGMGGMTTAAALAHQGRRVLVLEKHDVLGGLTHEFSRAGYRWDVGVHYVGAMHAQTRFGKILHRLTDQSLSFAALPEVYDRLSFNGDFEFGVRHPEQAYFDDLALRFPAERAGLQGYREAMKRASRAAISVFVARSVPKPIGLLMRWLKRAEIARWAGRTTAQVVADYTRCAELAAVLTAQWGDYGAPPCEGSFALHALTISSYWEGAFYPVGGARSIAPALLHTVQAAGGAVRSGAAVRALRWRDGRVVGVVLESGEELASRWVISGIGARETVSRLLPEPIQQQAWARQIMSLQPNVAHCGLYIGWRLRDGETPQALGVGAHNDWIYPGWDVAPPIWKDLFDQLQPPAMFVSFPSLKDPAHQEPQHTAELIVWVDWSLVDAWADTPTGQRDPEYLGVKGAIKQSMLRAFAQHYPQIAERMEVSELSTPLSTVTYTSHDRGAFYGLECTPRRMLCDALAPRTPVPGLVLTGQDVCGPGVQGAMAGGLFAAASIDPRVMRWFA